MSASPAISLLYITKRSGGMDVLFENLKRQTFRDFELVVVDTISERKDALAAYLQQTPVDFPVWWFPCIPYEDGRPTTLCRADNIGYANCHGELVVLLQDYIWIPAHALAVMWQMHQDANGKRLITNVGQRVEMVCGKVLDKEHPLSIFDHWCDHRPAGRVLYPQMRPTPTSYLGTITSQAWETNFAAVPRAVVDLLQGVEEDYDWGPASYDNQDISQRAELLGYGTTCDARLEVTAFDHYTWFDDRFGARVIPNLSNMERHETRMEAIRAGRLPIIDQDYLRPWRSMSYNHDYHLA